MITGRAVSNALAIWILGDGHIRWIAANGCLRRPHPMIYLTRRHGAAPRHRPFGIVVAAIDRTIKIWKDSAGLAYGLDLEALYPM